MAGLDDLIRICGLMASGDAGFSALTAVSKDTNPGEYPKSADETLAAIRAAKVSMSHLGVSMAATKTASMAAAKTSMSEFDTTYHGLHVPRVDERNTGWRSTTVAWLEENHPEYMVGTRSLAGARKKLSLALSAMSYKAAERIVETEDAWPSRPVAFTTPNPEVEREKLVACWDQPDHLALVEWLRNGGLRVEKILVRDGSAAALGAPMVEASAENTDEPGDLITAGELERLVTGGGAMTPDEDQELAEIERSLANPAAGSW